MLFFLQIVRYIVERFVYKMRKYSEHDAEHRTKTKQRIIAEFSGSRNMRVLTVS